MNPQSVKEAEFIIKGVSKEINKSRNAKVTICPPSPFIYLLKKIKSNKIIIGAQNVSNNIEGSHTGEVSPKMLSDMGVKQVIVGHGECRKMGETNELINEKILNLLKLGISPILCIGEGDRDNDGFYLSFVADQVKECLKNVQKSKLKNIIIAYEPLWAIGKDAKRGATKEEFVEMKIFIRKIISDIYDTKIAHSIPVLYGGSVNKDNARLFAIEGQADGLLIGRDSLNPNKFNAILNALN